MTRPRLLVSALTDHRPTCREQSLLEALQGSVLSQAISSWDVLLHIADSDPRPASEVVEGIDAVILLGGPDVHPEFYGMATGYPREGQHWPDGDRRQIELVLQCRQYKRPLLGICRGHQVINVAYGGTLIQDMEGHESPTLLDDHRFTRVPLTTRRSTAWPRDCARLRAASMARSRPWKTRMLPLWVSSGIPKTRVQTAILLNCS